MLSLRQLLTGVEEDDLLAFLLDVLNSLGFQATSWQTTSAARIFVQLVARVGSDLTFSIADIAASGFAGLATGPYADMLGQYMFSLLRVQATPSQGVMTLTSSPAASSHTWTAGALIIADAPEGSNANSWEVVNPGTINPGTSITVAVIGLEPGSQSNIPPGSTTLELRTPLVGVTVTNPPVPPTTPVNTWLTVPGTDTETDGPTGRYNARMLARWARLEGGTEAAYEAFALEALPALTRVSVRAGTVDGSVRITGATAVGGIDSGQITTIVNFLTGITDGIGRRLINDVLQVVSANQVTTPALGLLIYVSGPFASDAQTRVSTALTAYLGTLPIGGLKIANSSVGKVLLSQLYKIVTAQQGVLDVDFDFAQDIALGPDDIYAAIPNVRMTVVQG